MWHRIVAVLLACLIVFVAGWLVGQVYHEKNWSDDG